MTFTQFIALSLNRLFQVVIVDGKSNVDISQTWVLKVQGMAPIYTICIKQAGLRCVIIWLRLSNVPGVIRRNEAHWLRHRKTESIVSFNKTASYGHVTNNMPVFKILFNIWLHVRIAYSFNIDPTHEIYWDKCVCIDIDDVCYTNTEQWSG